MISNPRDKIIMPSLFCQVTANKSDQNILVSSQMYLVIFAKMPLRFVVEKQKYLKNVQTYALPKFSTGILANP